MPAATHRYLSAAAFLERVHDTPQILQLCDGSALATPELLQKAIDGTLSARLLDSFVFADTDGFNTRAAGMPSWAVQHISGPNAADGFFFAEPNLRGLPLPVNGTVTIDGEQMLIVQIGDKLLTNMTMAQKYAFLQYAVWCVAGMTANITTSEGTEFVSGITDRAGFVESGDFGILQRGFGPYAAIAHTTTLGSSVTLVDPVTFAGYGPYYVKRKQNSTPDQEHATGAYIVQQGEASSAAQAAAASALEILDAALSDAEDEADSYVGTRYTLPLTEAPSVLQSAVAALAFYNLWGTAAPELVTKKHDDAVAWLARVASGKATLAAATTPEPAVATTVLAAQDDTTLRFGGTALDGYMA